MTVGYDQSYRQIPDLFGADPEEILVEHLRSIDRTGPVLDVGGGQGRNALYLARQGLSVEVLDPSKVALEAVQARALEEGLPPERLRTRLGGFEEVGQPPEGGYSAILVFGLIQILSWEQIRSLQERLEQWTAPKTGLVFLTAFTTDDPGYQARLADPDRWIALGRRSFREGSTGEIRTFLEPGELARQLSEGFSLLHLWEGLGREHRHGEGPLERHGMVEAVLRRV